MLGAETREDDAVHSDRMGATTLMREALNSEENTVNSTEA